MIEDHCKRCGNYTHDGMPCWEPITLSGAERAAGERAFARNQRRMSDGKKMAALDPGDTRDLWEAPWL